MSFKNSHAILDLRVSVNNMDGDGDMGFVINGAIEKTTCFNCLKDGSSYLIGWYKEYDIENDVSYENSLNGQRRQWNLYFCEMCNNVVIKETIQKYVDGDNLYGTIGNGSNVIDIKIYDQSIFELETKIPNEVFNIYQDALKIKDQFIDQEPCKIVKEIQSYLSKV